MKNKILGIVAVVAFVSVVLGGCNTGGAGNAVGSSVSPTANLTPTPTSKKVKPQI